MNIPLHPVQTWQDADQLFADLLKQLPVRATSICGPVLQDPKFWNAPAAKGYHHNWTSGLAVHTGQVLWGAYHFIKAIPGFDLETLVVATIWHDYGKVFDYVLSKKLDGTVPKPELNSRWDVSDHYELIYHLPRSYAEFMISNNRKHLYSEDECRNIGNCILGHHYTREWQSPVEPKSLEAYAIHAADMVSSRYVETKKPVSI